MRRGAAVVAVLVSCLGRAPAAAAQSPVDVDVDGDGRPDVVARRTEAEVGGRQLVLMTTGRAPGEVALLAARTPSGLVPLWRGPVGARDVDAEWSVVIDLPSLTMFETRPDVIGCDGKSLPIYPRRFDVARGTWLPVTPAVPTAASTVLARRGAPEGLDDKTRPTVLRVEAVTDAAGDGGSAEGLVAPRELDDGRLDTAWTSAVGHAVGTRFVARGQRANLVALRVARGATPGRVTKLVVAAGDERVTVALPASGAGPFWAVLPEPIAATCVEVTLAETSAPAGRSALAELALLTDVDAGGASGLLRMAELVAHGGDGAAAAEQHLQARGSRGAEALVAQTARSDARARARVREALARIGDAAGAKELAAGLADADPESDSDDAARDRFQAALMVMGAAAIAPCAAVLGDERAGAPGRAAAAHVLGGQVAAAPSRVALVAVLGTAPPAVRRAAVLALAHATLAILLELAAREPPSARAADLWRAVALAASHAGNEDRARAGRAASAALAASPPYELRYRLIQALATASPDALSPVLAAEPEPALRTVAIESMPEPGPESILAAGLADPDPGVRAAALTHLAVPGAPMLEAGRIAETDPWPMVRHAAVEALAARCAGEPLHAVARSDADEDVRRAALAGLVRCKEPHVGPTLVAIAGSRDFSPALRAYAVSLLGPLGDKAQVPATIELLVSARGDVLAAPEPVAADGPIRRAAAAAHALGLLGDARATDALLAASVDASSAIRASAVTALAALCPRERAAELRDVFAAAAGADDALVVRSGRAARSACNLAGPRAP